MTPSTMGITLARVVVYSLDLSRKEACDLIVDTGATLSWVPEELAQRLGIRHTEVRTFRLADGRQVDRPVGDAIIECEGLRGATRIVLARPEDGSVLGLLALEGLGLEVDPTTRTLRRTSAFLALGSV
ncbi:MAG TPA: aspartyl protease family protein [Thermoplasmata archaeon]|nr:aspartyl protease family protein [Thermoplasmata archaeon]